MNWSPRAWNYRTAYSEVRKLPFTMIGCYNGGFQMARRLVKRDDLISFLGRWFKFLLWLSETFTRNNPSSVYAHERRFNFAYFNWFCLLRKFSGSVSILYLVLREGRSVTLSWSEAGVSDNVLKHVNAFICKVIKCNSMAYLAFIPIYSFALFILY